MNELMYGVGFILLALTYLQRDKIVDYLNYNFSIRMQSKTLAYILTFLLIIMVISGMLLNNTSEKFSGISKSYENLNPNNEENRPHRYFDVNTYD
ncbi:MAG: hypothetical protein CSA86_01630 [Arcobacter sp.]|nr:MAG: hypothetical protein CSA86_01630 [Arcobacter sp.]